MLYSCTHMTTLGVKEFSGNNFVSQYFIELQRLPLMFVLIALLIVAYCLSVCVRVYCV